MYLVMKLIESSVIVLSQVIHLKCANASVEDWQGRAELRNFLRSEYLLKDARSDFAGGGAGNVWVPGRIALAYASRGPRFKRLYRRCRSSTGRRLLRTSFHLVRLEPD